MFVVMAVEATEEQLNAVRGAILEEGLTPHENRGGARIVVAVLGEGGGLGRAPRRPALGASPASAVGHARRAGPSSSPRREFHPEDTVVHVGDVDDRRRVA